MRQIEIEHLRYTYPGAAAPTLRDVSLQVEQGDFLAIVGNNGCGKSTLCKALNGLIPQFITGEFSGRVQVCGLDTTATDIGTLACKVGYVYQDFENQIIRPTVLDDASYACLNYARPDYLARAAKRWPPAACRGGKRISSAAFGRADPPARTGRGAGAGAGHPDSGRTDRPAGPAARRRIYRVLRHLNEDLGKTILVIEHHTEYIADYCKHVLLLQEGRVAWQLPTDEALQRVEELEACNIFPPQVTIAADRLRRAGEYPAGRLPATVAEGRAVFAPRGGQSAPAPALRRPPRVRRWPSSGMWRFRTAASRARRTRSTAISTFRSIRGTRSR